MRGLLVILLIFSVCASVYISLHNDVGESPRKHFFNGNSAIECSSTKKNGSRVYFLEEVRYNEGDLYFFIDGSKSECILTNIHPGEYEDKELIEERINAL